MNECSANTLMHFLVLKWILEYSLQRFFNAQQEIHAKTRPTVLVEGIGVSQVSLSLRADKQGVAHFKSLRFGA